MGNEWDFFNMIYIYRQSCIYIEHKWKIEKNTAAVYGAYIAFEMLFFLQMITCHDSEGFEVSDWNIAVIQ